ncbi:nuclear transport factor 2 family protein [Amycolatopsis echigonensis]|uniref:Nuclear transport factor 2 family protein n=1 Tax=Amycolatopsis echigonensis TaxID=2576905 RepID=A0A8E1W3C6_9PSEU|nr:nuclear transport factor 2 family protein [Amycolatopsis echigonensis]MBB2502970.1 nuclear transport factor 2 family protein [Amycolatopsis echigonensis]
MSLEERVRRMEDLHALQQLRARYCQYLDDGRWKELVELFTRDGAFVGLSAVRGHAELLDFFPGLQKGSLSSWWHFSANETLELAGDTATGETWLLQPCVVDGRAQLAAGRYADRMVRAENEGWLFDERKVTFFWWSDLAEGWDAGRFAWPPARVAADDRYPPR